MDSRPLGVFLNFSMGSKKPRQKEAIRCGETPGQGMNGEGVNASVSNTLNHNRIA